jgi:hypothetical protein
VGDEAEHPLSSEPVRSGYDATAPMPVAAELVTRYL